MSPHPLPRGQRDQNLQDHYKPLSPQLAAAVLHARPRQRQMEQSGAAAADME